MTFGINDRIGVTGQNTPDSLGGDAPGRRTGPFGLRVPVSESEAMEMAYAGGDLTESLTRMNDVAELITLLDLKLWQRRTERENLLSLADSWDTNAEVVGDPLGRQTAHAATCRRHAQEVRAILGVSTFTDPEVQDALIRKPDRDGDGTWS